MTFGKMLCCAIEEIGGLKTHLTAEEAMVAFCKEQILKPVKFGTSPGRVDAIYSFYIFTAAVGDGYSKKYGHNFAAFIRENSLGSVWESDFIMNNAFHPDHGNQVWVWTPDHEALKAWWSAYEEEQKKKQKVKPVATCIPPVNTWSQGYMGNAVVWNSTLAFNPDMVQSTQYTSQVPVYLDAQAPVYLGKVSSE